MPALAMVCTLSHPSAYLPIPSDRLQTATDGLSFWSQGAGPPEALGEKLKPMKDGDPMIRGPRVVIFSLSPPSDMNHRRTALPASRILLSLAWRDGQGTAGIPGGRRIGAHFFQ